MCKIKVEAYSQQSAEIHFCFTNYQQKILGTIHSMYILNRNKIIQGKLENNGFGKNEYLSHNQKYAQCCLSAEWRTFTFNTMQYSHSIS